MMDLLVGMLPRCVRVAAISLGSSSHSVVHPASRLIPVLLNGMLLKPEDLTAEDFGENRCVWWPAYRTNISA